MPNLKLEEVIKHFKNSLKDYYHGTEINSLTNIVFRYLTGMSPIQLHTNNNKPVTENDYEKLNQIIAELVKQKPIQYILGETEFYGINLKINAHVLIPRPETEELVHWIIEDHEKEKISILDIGTGSGCIALALAKNIKNANITGLDISKKAIELARENAAINKLKANFIVNNIVSIDTINKKYDVIVSNPPYVLDNEKTSMQKNVLDYEPHVALFVPDNDPLFFYKAIVNYAKKALVNSGFLYFEINEKYGEECKKLIEENGFLNIEIRKDINGKVRMIKAANYL